MRLKLGLSSDPAMNWRLSKLDRYALVSNSDCHSFWPWRIGREANVFDLHDFTYKHVTSAIIDNDPERFKFTIETDPAYGKYHWTGHRNCKISLHPRKPSNSATSALFAAENSPKASNNESKNLPTAQQTSNVKCTRLYAFAAAFRNHRRCFGN